MGNFKCDGSYCSDIFEMDKKLLELCFNLSGSFKELVEQWIKKGNNVFL